MSLPERALDAPPIRTVAEALAPPPGGEVWIVGGTVRDALLGRALRDVDLAVRGDAAAAAHAVARRVRGPAFPLSERFGGWRVIDRTGTGSATSRHSKATGSSTTWPAVTSPSTRWRCRWAVATSWIPTGGGETSTPA